MFKALVIFDKAFNVLGLRWSERIPTYKGFASFEDIYRDQNNTPEAVALLLYHLRKVGNMKYQLFNDENGQWVYLYAYEETQQEFISEQVAFSLLEKGLK